MLLRFFQCVDRRRRAEGVSLWHALRFFSWKWDRTAYRSDPRKRRRFSRYTLRSLYYKWVRSGRDPAVLLLKVREPRGRISGNTLSDFVRLLSTSGSTKKAYLGLVESRRDDAPPRWRLEEAVRGPVRAALRRQAAAECELGSARAELEALICGNGGCEP